MRVSRSRNAPASRRGRRSGGETSGARELSDNRPQFTRLWQAAAIAYPEAGLRTLVKRIRYAVRARRVWPLLAQLLDAAPSSPLGRFVAARTDVLGFVDAPFINASWDAETRLSTFLRQFHHLQTMGKLFSFDAKHSVELLQLEELAPDYHVVLDKPKWFQREGLLTLNIFRRNLRLISLSFSFDRLGNELIVMVGAIQGRRIEGALDEYRELTKLAHGLRPRDLLVDILRMLGAHEGAARMIAVSDACRHHRSPYFDRNVGRELPLDYDEIWRDRGGVDRGDGFYELPVERQVRNIDDIPSKKRQMYRQRYAMLDSIEARLRDALPGLEPVVRPEAD